MTATTLDLSRKTNTTLSGSVIGANLASGAPGSTGTGVSYSAGTLTCTAAANIAFWLGIITPGRMYQITLNYTMSAGSKLRVTNGTGGGSEIMQVSAALAASGSLTFNFTAIDVNVGFEADTALFSGTISSIVVKEVAPTVATSTGAGGACSSRMMSGKTYFEGVITTLTGTPSIGIAVGTWGTNVALQSGTATLGYLATGAVQINGTTLATIATWAAGNRIDCAIDPGNRLIWFRVNGGNWNNNAANDPATGVGGIDFSTMLEGSLEAAVYASLTGNVWTMHFSSADFVGTPPSGFASLDAISYSTVDSTGDRAVSGSMPASYGFAALTDNTSRGKHFSPAGPLTVVSGITKEAGSPVANKKVEVYDRLTGDLLGCTYSDGSGNWSIQALGRPAVRIVGSDPTTYNSVVFDNVVPV